MSIYHVTYNYLATGMEGIPDHEDFGLIEAMNAKDACAKVSQTKYPVDIMYGAGGKLSTRAFFQSCLSAEIV